jgi:hypothetical protein
LRKDGEQRLLLLAWLVGCAGAGAPTRFWWRAAGCVLRHADEYRACPGASQIRRGQPQLAELFDDIERQVNDSLEYKAHYVTGALTPKPQH